MRGFIVLSTILAALFIAGAAAAARSQAQPADAQRFIDEARASGYTDDDAELLRNGYLICAARSSADDDLVQRGIDTVQGWLGKPNDPARDAAFIALAEKNLCPGMGKDAG
jgi:hypothetical protein